MTGSGGSPPVRRVLGSAPASVVRAVRLMYVRAGVGIVGLLVLLATKDSLRRQIQHRHPTLSGTRLAAATNAGVLVGLVTGSLFILIYVALAVLVRRGEQWARTVALALAGLGALVALVSLAQPKAVPTRAVTLLGAFVDVAIIWFLTRRATGEFFHPGDPDGR